MGIKDNLPAVINIYKCNSTPDLLDKVKQMSQTSHEGRLYEC